MSTQYRPPTFAETVLRPFFARETYLGLAYALLGLPLGIFYFVFLVTGLSVGLGLAVTVVGIPILVLTIVACRGLAQLERTLAVSLLGASMPRVANERGGGVLWRRLAGQVRSGTTWRELTYLMVRFPTGVASFSIAVSVVAAGGYAIVEPMLVASGVHGVDFGGWQIDSVGEALLLVPPGIALLLVAPVVLTLQARLERALAVFLLAR
ncbi:MAG: sensor domain-containing protein, partial [Gaiellaceae bacterium]